MINIRTVFIVLVTTGLIVFFFEYNRPPAFHIAQYTPSTSLVNSPTQSLVNIDAFIPAGWTLLDRVDGDLNADGLADIAFIIEDHTNPLVQEFVPRRLVVLLQSENGYEVSAISDTAIMLADEGGIWGDPYSGISIDQGSLLLGFYGGSNWRWSYTYRFRYQDGGWYLIGQTNTSFWTGEPNKVIRTDDYNYLTGKVKVTTGSGLTDDYTVADNLDDLPIKDTVTWADIKNNTLLDLKDFPKDLSE